MKKILMVLVLVTLCFPIMVNAESDTVKLAKCVDGDTARFIIKNKEYSTRFLAIDTPETVKPNTPVQPFGKEASNYTCSKLKSAKKIVLEYDNNATKEDKYGRRLAWIFVDGDLLQKELVSKGYAKVAYLYDDYKYTNILKKAEKNAKNKTLGIWSDKTSSSDDTTIDISEILEKLYKYVRKEIKNML